jgi:hypothetical protein
MPDENVNTAETAPVIVPAPNEATLRREAQNASFYAANPDRLESLLTTIATKNQTAIDAAVAKVSTTFQGELYKRDLAIEYKLNKQEIALLSGTPEEMKNAAEYLSTLKKKEPEKPATEAAVTTSVSSAPPAPPTVAELASLPNRTSDDMERLYALQFQALKDETVIQHR